MYKVFIFCRVIMTKSIFAGQYIFYFDFPNYADPRLTPPPAEEQYPILTCEENNNQYAEYIEKLKVQCDSKMVWLISAVPTALESLEDAISLRQLCEYFNTSDFWKINGEWPQAVPDEKLRAFNIEVFKNWLFQKTARHFYAQNQDNIPSLTEYKLELIKNLKQFKEEILALDALHLMKSHFKTYLLSLWESYNPKSNQDKFGILNIDTVKKIIKEKGLFPEDMQFTIWPDNFEYWQQIHRNLMSEIIVIMNDSILDEINKRCLEHFPDTPFEQLYKAYWPSSKNFDDHTPPLRSMSEVNEFMEKMLLAAEQRSKSIEEKKKGWTGSDTGFDVAMARTQALLGSQQTNNEEFSQLLSQQLKQVEAEDHVLESLSLVNTNPIQVVTQMLQEERVDNVAKLAPVIVRDIQHVIEHMSDKPTSVDHSKNVETLDQFVVSVRSACNRAALVDLYDRLERETSKLIAETIIGNWEVIGTDIRDSERMITESDKLRIIAYAQGKKTKQQYDDEMLKLRVKLDRGEVTPQEEVVIKMFPKLKQALTRLPKEYLQDFSLVLKRAFVHQQITHPEKFMQNPHEMAVFSALGLDSSKIKTNKELIQQKIKHVIQNAVLNGQKEDEIPTLKELQEQIEMMALKEKIIASGGNPSLTPMVHKLTKARQELIAAATLLLEQEYEKCKTELNAPNKNISQHIESSLIRSKAKILHSISRVIDQKIKDNKDGLALVADQLGKIKEIISPLTAQTSEKMRARLLSDVGKDTAFFEKWGDPIQYENIQGFVGGDGEILGAGVCQANTYRLITREMTSLARNQTLSESQWKAEVKISPQDRFNQALYQVGLGEEASNGLSKAVLKRLHLKKIQLVHKDWRYADKPAFDSDAIYQVLSQAVNQQQKSKLKNYGIVKLSLGHHATKQDGTQATDQGEWGHAIYLRYDPKRKVAYFYDPNHGRSINFYTWKKLEEDADFKKMSQKEQDETILNYMLMCFSEMIVNDFDDVNTIKSFEMEMDLSVIDKLVSAKNTILGGINNFFNKKNEKDSDNHTKNLNEKRSGLV